MSRRFVAVHPDVVEALLSWQQTGHEQDVAKFMALLRALLGSDQRLVDYQLKRNAVQSIQGAPGLFEVGPKVGRGGVPRLFLRRRDSGSWVVAAGLEKSGRGARELGKATRRAADIPADPVFPAGAVREGSLRFQVLWKAGELEALMRGAE